jgi:cell division protein FtsI/penicillin-binding protein 2
MDTDMVGSSGLQAAYEEQLAGTPGGSVLLVDRRTGERRDVLWRTEPVEGEPLRTTLDYRVQDAAERAIAGQTKTTVLVAVDARTGEVLADANGPEVTSYNTGFIGQYPPGSTFKIVSAAALIAGGHDVDVPADCPSTTVVDGKRFKNYEFTSLAGGATFADTLAASCNTTVVGLAHELDDAALARTARDMFGIGAEWDLPLEAYSGSVPEATSLVDRAASMIGQGRVLMSPLALATVAATVASGQARSPALVPGQGGEPTAGALPRPLADDLRTVMRLVVTQGTATSLRGLPGDVGAKTGTAEFGSGDPPRTHGWLIGFRGDIAFACLVVEGAGGNSDAGPVVRRFLELAPGKVS